jgi:hypothetical protein
VSDNKVVAGPCLPESLEERSVVTDVLLAKHGLDGTSSFLSMVEGNATITNCQLSCLRCDVKSLNLREEMVNNVELDDAVEQLTADKSKVSVNSGQSTLLESPCTLLEVLGLVVVVVKVSDGDFMSLAIVPVEPMLG